MPSFGTQIKYLKGDKLTVNWSTFIGTDDPDSVRRMRYYNNLYVQVQLTKKLGFIAGFDIGEQQTKSTVLTIIIGLVRLLFFATHLQVNGLLLFVLNTKTKKE